MNWFVWGNVFIILSIICFYFCVRSRQRGDNIQGIISIETLIFSALSTVLGIVACIFCIIHITKKQTDLEYYLQFQDHNNKAEMFCYNEFLTLNKEKFTVSFKDFNIKSCVKKLNDKDLKEKQIIPKIW